MKKRNNKKWIIILVIIIAVGLGGYWAITQRNASSIVSNSTVFTIKADSISLVSLASGKVSSAESTSQRFNGTLSSLEVAVGDLVEANQKLGEALNQLGQRVNINAQVAGIITSVPSALSNEFVISNPDKLQVQIAIGEKDIHKISLDQQAIVFIEAIGLEFEGVVVAIGKIGNTNLDYTTYPVTISFDQQDADVFIGMSASAKIEIERKDNIAVVPFEAIIASNTNRYLLSSAWLENQNRPQSEFYIPITTGIADVYNIEVFGEQLIGQDILILPRSSSFPFLNR